MTVVRLSGSHATATVSTTAGMLLDAAFLVAGREVRPFARADWIDEPLDDPHPGHLRKLAAEFVAVPFGSAGAPADLDDSWAHIVPTDPPAEPHGISADAEWSVQSSADDAVTLTLDYPEHHDIARLERTIRLRQDSAAIDFELTITARRTCRTAVGLHPILRLPEHPHALALDVDFDKGFTYPGSVWPGVGPTRPSSTFTSLTAVPAKAGGTVDLSHLPLGAADDASSATEDVVLLAGVRSPLQARFDDDRVTATLDWDRQLVPCLLVWLSDRALADEPWRGRYRGLGLEPIAAAFDFAGEVSLGSNPLAQEGYSTAIDVAAGSPVTIRYSVEVSSIDAYV